MALPARRVDRPADAAADDAVVRTHRARWAPAAALGALTAALVLAWVRARPWDSRMVNLPAKFGALSALVALVGLLWFAVTVVLSARLRFLEGPMGGLDRVYRAHHRLGAIAFSLLALHPILLAWRYAQVSWARAAEVWRPTTGDWPLVAGQVALYAMTACIVMTMYVVVRHQTFVRVQRVLGLMLLPAAFHALRVGGDTSSYGPLRWFVWAVVVTGSVALVAHTVLGRFTSPHRAYRVASVARCAGAVTEVWLRPAGRPLRFVPGQFAFVRFDAAALGGESHPYSIASPPSAEGLRFVIKDLGDYTHHVAELEPGVEATVEGPYGRFSHRFVRGHRQVWVGGGIGIAPFLSMAASLPRAPYQVDLFYGFADAHDAPFLDELASRRDANPALRVHLVDERVDGFVHASSIAAAIGSLARCEFLLCGPPAMMHALREELTDAGVARSRVHFEEFGFS